VTIAVVVDTLGHVSSTRVLSSSGIVLLDQAAMGAASQCLFRPGYQRDRPVAVEMSIPFKFRLE
jgi:TonB family protein